MKQRQLRLGDTLDDYCPRERRLTNHAVVAMVGDQIRQTRCTTCDAEHPYKGAKVPPRRKKAADSPAGAYEEVLATVIKKDGDAVTHPNGNGQPIPGEAEEISLPDAQPAAPPAIGASADGPVHRPLIRATLPRTDNPQASRPVPEFTIRQTRRPGKFQGRGPDARFPKGRGPIGHGPMGHDGGGRGPGGPRGAGHVARSGHRPPGPGMRSGPQPPRHAGKGGFRPGKKRSR